MSPIAIPTLRKHSIACIPADGIGPEVISAGVEVLKTLSDTLGTFSLEFEDYDWSSETYKQTGKYIPDDGLKQLKKHDAILFGAVGAPDYANVRPTKILKGTSSPLRNASHGDLDWVIVRENSEGEYAGQGGRSHRGKPWETATEVSIFTRHAVERIMRFAFETAQKRRRKQLTVVTKSNAQRNGLVLWDDVAADVANEYPDVKMDKMLVDAMTCRMVLKPQSLDTIVATNLHADILSDLAAALAGSIGIAPTSNLDPTRENPSMFEPIHGSAFDIMGKGIANLVATFWTASEMLAWLGEEEAAKYLLDCVEKVTENGIATTDLGGSNTTKDVTQAVCEEIRRIGLPVSMAPDQWTITKKKNVSNRMAERQPRKRTRLSVAPSQGGQRQQTLTQAQWIPSRSPSFQDESHLRPFKERSGRIINKARVKRDSTLTQMDFFRDIHVQEELDDAPLDEVDAATHLARLNGSDDQETRVKTAGGPKTSTQKLCGHSREDYEPAKKRRKHNGATSVAERNVRRMSKRLAGKDDTSNNLLAGPGNTFGEAIHVSLEKPASGQYRVLEVQDSTGTDIDDVQLSPQSQYLRRPAAPPETPLHTAKKVILSSQSPEGGKCLGPVESGGRSGARKAALVEEAKEDDTSSTKGYVKSVIENTGIVPEAAEEEHAAAQIKSGRFASVMVASYVIISSAGKPVEAEVEKEESNETEIPGTSQAEEDIYLAEETPTSEADGAIERGQGQGRGQQTEEFLSGVLVRDFAPASSHTTSCKRKDESANKEAAPPKTPLPRAANQGKLDEQEEDSDVDFDSPIANDTQFNAEVAEDSFVIPTPRLIHSTSRPRSSQANEQQQQQGSKRSCPEGLLPPAPETGRTTTLVPLNDTSTTTTQRSVAAEVRPASMPHPSQISTQEATQFGLLSSLVPAAESPEASSKKERITIKEDSSSIGLLSLSQIPRAEKESQGVDLESEEEEEEIDLDECLNDHLHHDHPQLGAASRTIIKQESQLDQRAVAVGQGGFNNDTQSNFTQGGHVTAAYIHQQRDWGILPKWYTPKPYRVPGYTRR
ncbi:hypothetical protein DV736_g5829, partial [Chaetothyriales sp. CBS 134916]